MRLTLRFRSLDYRNAKCSNYTKFAMGADSVRVWSRLRRNTI